MTRLITIAFSAFLVIGCASTQPSDSNSVSRQTFESGGDVFEAPHLIGGLKGLQRELERLSQESALCRRRGRVLVEFKVMETGKIEDVTIKEGIGTQCDLLAARAIIASRFLPGKTNGVPAPAVMSLPIRFR